MRTKIIYLRFYYYHWVDITAGGLLVPKGIVYPVVGVTITRSISLLVGY